MRTESEKKAFVRYKIMEVKCSESDMENARLILRPSSTVRCNTVHSQFTAHVGVF